MGMKAISLKPLKSQQQDLISAFPDVEFKFTSGVGEIDEADKASVDILFGYDGDLDEVFLASCPELKWIAWFATGVNNPPLDYIENNGIRLTNGKGIHAKQMAEFNIAYILDDYKNMKTSHINQLNKVYDSKMTGTRLMGKTALILGTGEIARRTAYLLHAFDVKVLGINTSGHDADEIDEAYKLDALTDVLPQADIVINTLPETEDTIHLLQRKHFEVMKDDALFINVGRGTVVEENVLVEVLKDKVIRQAYLDVFENEPLTEDNPLYSLDNVVITAHITGNGKENNQEATDMFKRNLSHFLNKNELIENEVNPTQGY